MSSHNNIVTSLDGKFEIYVSACTEEWANVSVSYVNYWRWGSLSVQRKLDLKTFVLAKGELPVTHPGAIPMFEYLTVLQTNKEIILALCRRLNEKICFVCNDIETTGDKPYLKTNHGLICDICFSTIAEDKSV